jgi:hypothetical protein
VVIVAPLVVAERVSGRPSRRCGLRERSERDSADPRRGSIEAAQEDMHDDGHERDEEQHPEVDDERRRHLVVEIEVHLLAISRGVKEQQDRPQSGTPIIEASSRAENARPGALARRRAPLSGNGGGSVWWCPVWVAGVVTVVLS